MIGRSAPGVLAELTDKQRQRTGLILKQILDHGQLTRPELSTSLGLSVSSIAKYVKPLIDGGFVREVERSEDGPVGRSAVLELDPTIGCNIVLMLDLNTVHAALVSLRGDIIVSKDEPVFFGIRADDLLGRMLDAIRGLVAEVEQRRRTLFGIGIGMGGAINQLTGVSYDYRYASEWGIVAVKQIVEERFAVPCFVLHDTNAIAVGEKHFGYGVGVSSFLTVWISDGISLGAVINGEVHLGNEGFLGEFGHVHAVENGPLCYCGHSGCLETVTKESYIIEKVAAGLRSGVHSEISTLTGGDPRRMTIEEIKKAANDGDRFCKLIFEEVAGHIGAKLSDVINVLNPGLVTLRGSVIDDNPFLFENIYRIIHNRSVRFTSNSVQLNYGQCGEHIGIKGLGSWILSNYFLGH